jgi:hypothetical protein
MTKYVSKQQRLGHLWLAEVDRFEYDDGDGATVACADLADELWHHQIAAAEDPNYQTELDEWTAFVYEHQLMLPLEQSCHEGVLLPTGQRAIRLESCPEELLDEHRRPRPEALELLQRPARRQSWAPLKSDWRLISAKCLPCAIESKIQHIFSMHTAYTR